MTYITINTVNLQVLDIQLDPQLNRPTKSIVGTNGSNTSYQGMGGRLITISIVASGDRYQKMEWLYKYGKRVSLISKSSAKYNGFYHITSFTVDENRPNHFKITMKLQEDYTFNMVRVNFVTYQVKAQVTGTELKVGDKWQVSAS
jgi:phage protein U